MTFKTGKIRTHIFQRSTRVPNETNLSPAFKPRQYSPSPPERTVEILQNQKPCFTVLQNPFPQDRLDLPLDALIAESKQQRRHNSHAHQPRGHNGHFGGGGSTSGPSRRPMNRNAYRTAPYPTLPEMQGQPGPRRIELPLALSQAMNSEGSTKLYISNLDYDVTNRDIELLFSEVGELERHSIHYDKSGRSKGTAEVVYKHYSDALAAIERYNNQHLDGKKVEIKLVG
ncbi:THO complex subunit 4B-like, partial [Rosa chinensis]|uniref:THO complex subunit 4B-like n=1 Tax=Rosa chinensis TaxID=74649 RepID=UPI001AD8F020